jgi:hypothetical protein
MSGLSGNWCRVRSVEQTLLGMGKAWEAEACSKVLKRRVAGVEAEAASMRTAVSAKMSLLLSAMHIEAVRGQVVAESL